MWEEEIIEADSVDEAFEKVGLGNAVEYRYGDFHDYYDEDHELISEQINDPLVDMIKEYDQVKQLELFDEITQ